MNNGELVGLVETIRSIAGHNGVNQATLDRLKKNPVVPNQLLDKYFKSDRQLAETLLIEEQEQFEKIFKEYNFENDNAIDILFTVSKEIADNFYKYSPALTQHFRELYPDIYNQYLNNRIEFIYDKIQINLKKGIWQRLYRNDLSIELIARRYISRLIDLYNPENFPPEQLSFNTLFHQMIENFVKSIATEKGMKYWCQKKEIFGFQVK